MPTAPPRRTHAGGGRPHGRMAQEPAQPVNPRPPHERWVLSGSGVRRVRGTARHRHGVGVDGQREDSESHVRLAEAQVRGRGRRECC
jgi:hypothetical protein